ncbi:MAG: hypothetical protein QW507_00640 [Candidatus Nanoarchaeia archaeon]|nr:hypothetical protein [Candidatus Haiyanarchaeum thermophilum]MCW1302911.1 hypothetical protein [Candidatus Haiyanarchaeum thermophilum]MCW1303590.1 hypothetical protein [Candidatus Haiyanarchaeum thermophilum]MCW1306272.1 hypothetical protein [Candidatus Haiyanarchaeum thermophilum]MCW1307492.1 hypothetical protein [Candidatus Haiyanarchaeum thermophilum]
MRRLEKEELLRKAEEEIEKAKKIVRGVEHLPPESIKNYLQFLLNTLNYLAKAMYGEDFILDEVSPQLIDENLIQILETYFYIKSLLQRDFKRISRTKFRADSRKYSIFFTKEDMDHLCERVSSLLLAFRTGL